MPIGAAALGGTLTVPKGAPSTEPVGIVLFAHGSGSSRFSTRRLRFDIGLLAARLVGATDWLTQNQGGEATAALATLRVGYFGASTGAAAALLAAAARPDAVHAVVSRGGRPDLAGSELPRVRAPTLLIVGGDDVPVIAMNEEAYAGLRCEKQLEIIPGATHLFEEPGTLDDVARLARDWFTRHLAHHPPHHTSEPG
jgi:pimeloyl-ACP methyl ester carboxylesterase